MSHKKEAHTGGAWKVAYADFVTAMMALFLVLWIVAMSQEMKENIAGYFRSSAMRKPIFKRVGMLVPITQISRTPPRTTPPKASSSADQGGQSWAARVLMVQATLREIASKILNQLQKNNAELTDTDEFRMEFMNDGFRLNVMDRNKHPLFEAGTANITEYGRWVLRSIAWEVERYPFQIEIEGHTHQGERFSGEPGEEWDLSTKRALAVQQILIYNKVRPEQFWRVAGYADQQPLDNESPKSELNRRITIIMRLDPNANVQDLRGAFSPP